MCEAYLDAFLLGYMPGSPFPAMAKNPIYDPPVQAGIDPSNVFRVFGTLDILDGGKVLASLAHDVQRRGACSLMQIRQLIPCVN